MIAFRGQKKFGPRPDWFPLGVSFKISDEHPRPFQMGVLPPGLSLLEGILIFSCSLDPNTSNPHVLSGA